MSETTSPYEPSQSSEDRTASPLLNDEQTTAHDDKLEPSGFKSNSEILRHRDQPDMIARGRTLSARDGKENAELADKYEAFTKALFKLSNYGINVAGIGNYRETIGPGSLDIDMVYTTTQRVNGKNMRENMREIPQEVVESAVGGMLRYYEDMLADNSNALYLTDLGLGQLLWGREPGGSVDEAYLVDLDIHYTSRRRQLIDFANSFIKLAEDIGEMERTYNQDYSHYREWLIGLRKRMV